MNSNQIIATQVGWENTVVMICEKCGKQFEDGLKNSPERIKSELKTKSKEEFGQSVRVITTSCLNICPQDKIAIAKASSTGDSVFRAYAVDPSASGEDLYQTIFKK